MTHQFQAHTCCVCAAETARDSDERLARIAENLPGILYQARVSYDGVVSYPYVSGSVTSLIGTTSDDLRADPSLLRHSIDPEDRGGFIAALAGRCQEHGTLQWEGRVTAADGSVRWLSLVSRAKRLAGGSTVRDGVVLDTTDLHHARERVSWSLDHDPLTGLPNRMVFLDRLGQALVHAEAGSGSVGVCLLDLDHFTAINELHGHAVGDELLCAVERRIRGVLRPQDTLARHGGDELKILLPALPTRDSAAELAGRIVQALQRPVDVGARALAVSCSVGVAVAPEDGIDAELLLRRATAAMKRAKASGRARVETHDRELSRRSEARVLLGRRLQEAIGMQEFHLVYQPQVDAGGGHRSVEALLRWQPTGQETIAPAEFIPLAEELGLIGAIGRWVLREACLAAASWQASGSPTRVAVNLSPAQLADSGLAALVAETLAETRLPSCLLELELTETALMEQGEAASGRIGELRMLGVRVSLDDFGTGYSSLARLQHLPLDALKIDRSFIAEIGRGTGTAIVASIIDLGHTIGLEVVAEGIETVEQRLALQGLGVDRLQGYLIGRPATELTLTRECRERPSARRATRG